MMVLKWTNFRWYYSEWGLGSADDYENNIMFKKNYVCFHKIETKREGGGGFLAL